MRANERQKQLDELTSELLRERALISAGGAPENPGRSKELRRTIARLHTIIAEEARAQSREA